MPGTTYHFKDRSGYIVSPETTLQAWLAIGHTALVPPWADPRPHRHTVSEEFYIVLRGELQFAVAGTGLTLRPGEILMLHPNVPHAILGGSGPIEHFGLRAPAFHDKQSAGEKSPPVVEDMEERDLRREWGCRVSLRSAHHHNCWLFGAGSAQFDSRHLILAYLNFPTWETANAGLGSRHQMHYHQRGWEYYVVLRGKKTLLVEDELVAVEPGEILEVPPQVPHTLHSREAPFEGFTLRAPVDLNDKVVV